MTDRTDCMSDFFLFFYDFFSTMVQLTQRQGLGGIQDLVDEEKLLYSYHYYIPL